MKAETVMELKRYIISFINKQMSRFPYTIEELKRAYPFHSLFFPDEALKAFKVQRSLVTKMGQTLFPNLAAIILREAYSDVHVNWKVQANLEANKLNLVNQILDGLDARKRKPDAIQEMANIRVGKFNECKLQQMFMLVILSQDRCF